MLMIEQLNHNFIMGFVVGATASAGATWYLVRKTDLSRDKLSLLQMLNVIVLLAYMFVSKNPQETVIITLAGFLFGEPLGRVIAGGKDDKKKD